MPNCIVIYATGEIDKIKFNKYEMVNLKSNSEVIYINNLCLYFKINIVIRIILWLI